MLDAPGAGLAAPADRRRAAGRSPGTSRARSATWSTRGSSCPRRPRTAPRAACRSPSSPSTAAGRCRWSPTASTCTASRCTIEGSELLARAIQHETDHLDGVLFIDRLDPDDPQGRDEGDPRVGVVRAGAAHGQGLPARHPRARPLMRVVFAGTPEVAAARARRGRRLPPRAGRRRHPPRRPGRPRPQAGRQPGRPAGRGARRTRPQARAPARPRVPGRRCASWRPTAARWSRTAPCCRSPRSTSRRTAGSTCTSPCCPPGAAPPRSSTRSGPATRSPGRPRSGSSRSSTPGPTFGVMTERIRPTDTAGDLLGRLAEGGAGLLVVTLDGIEDGSLRGPRAAGGRASAWPPRSSSRTPASTGPSRPPPSTAGSGPARPAPAPGRRTTASGSRSARSALDRAAEPLAPGVLEVAQERRARRHRHQRRPARRGQGVRQEADGGRRLGPRRARLDAGRPRFGGRLSGPGDYRRSHDPPGARRGRRRDLPGPARGRASAPRGATGRRTRCAAGASCSTARRTTPRSTPRPASSTTTCW